MINQLHRSNRQMLAQKWVARLWSNRCPPADGWMGLRYALISSQMYGFASITPDLDMLKKKFQDLYHQVLSPLCVNQKITKFYRMAPKMYQGICNDIYNPKHTLYCYAGYRAVSLFHIYRFYVLHTYVRSFCGQHTKRACETWSRKFYAVRSTHRPT